MPKAVFVVTGSIVSVEIRSVWPNGIPWPLMSGAPVLLTKCVFEVPAPNVLGVVFGDPLPMSVIPTVIVTPEVQVQVPAGIWMTSPATAVCVGPLMTAFTSE